MNPLVLSLADGTAFFVGLMVVLVANLSLLLFRTRITLLILTVLALVAAVLVIASATPLPFWLYGLWLFAAIASLVLGNLAKPPRHFSLVAAAFLLVVTVTMCFAEAPHQRLPRVPVRDGKTVYVLGDSISAGTGGVERCWPTVLGDISSFAVVNLAQPGATVQSAFKQAEGITIPSSIVVVEIGGNDLAAGTEAVTFRRQLDSLVSLLRSSGHQVVMFELPLFPFKNAFGQAQRQIAAKHGVVLLPKRCLTRVLGLKEGTLDGLHLSQKGHHALAETVAQVLEKSSSMAP